METTIYSSEKHPHVVVVEVHGDVECGECGTDRLCGLLHNLVDSGDRWIVLDVSKSGSMDERALAEMLAVIGRLRLRDGDMIVVAKPGDLPRTMRTMGFHELTVVLDDVEMAIEQAALKAGATREQ